MRDIQALCTVVGKSLEKIPRILPGSMKEKGTEVPVSEEALKVAFQGERGAFSELAVRRSFDENVSVLPCHSFQDTFDAVSSGKAKYGVLPVENTLGGTIYDTLDLLAMHPELTVVGEQQVRVIHNLIGMPDAELGDIKKVYSHPQGLAQCTRFLSEELPDAERIPFFDTAGAVSFIAEKKDKSLAAIAGAPAAVYHGLKIIRQGIETDASNYTRFYVITREENAELFRSQSKLNKAAISFSVSDQPGALMDVLKIFADREINMKKLESRPIPGKPWEYLFFLEFQLPEDGSFDDLCKDIKEKCATFRVLGLYASVL